MQRKSEQFCRSALLRTALRRKPAHCFRPERQGIFPRSLIKPLSCPAEKHELPQRGQNAGRRTDAKERRFFSFAEEILADERISPHIASVQYVAECIRTGAAAAHDRAQMHCGRRFQPQTFAQRVRRRFLRFCRCRISIHTFHHALYALAVHTTTSPMQSIPPQADRFPSCNLRKTVP